MQTGMKAGLAIILAVFLTGVVGFLTAVVPEDEERTYYDQVSDLTPIVDYSAIESYSEYNPVTNVSGWADATGVEIPFLTSGISAYPYRHYVQSVSTADYTTLAYTSGILDPDWTSIESTTWYPLAKVYPLTNTAGVTVEQQGISAERVAAGHVIIESDYQDTDATTFSVYFGHYDGNTLVHGFTYTFKEDLQSGNHSEEHHITSLSQFDGTASEEFVLNTLSDPISTGISAYVEIDVTLPDDHSLYVAFIVAQDEQTSVNPGFWFNLANGLITPGQEFLPVNPYVSYGGGISWRSDSENVSGRYVSITNNITIDGVAADPLDAWTLVSMKQLVSTYDIEDWSTMFSNYTFYYGTTSYTGDITVSNAQGTFTANLTSYPGYICYVTDNECWYPAVLSDNGLYYEPDTSQPGYPSDQVFIAVKGYRSGVAAYSTYPVYEYKYVDANKFVEIDDDTVGTWENYMDSSTGGYSAAVPYNNGVVELLTVPGTVISSDKVFYRDTDGNTTQGSMTLTVPTSIPYSMARVVLDFQNNNYYAQGIVWGSIDEDERGTGNWTLRPYQYPITPTFTGLSDVSYVQGMSFEKSGGTKVFILNTSVQTDPMGRLWGDPTIYLGYYFPDYFTYDSTTGNTGVPTTAIRMLINGVVSYGDSLTINGQDMSVADGNITFTYYTYETETVSSADPNVPPTTNTITVTNEGNMPIKGMAIDWEDGHVYLVFTEQGKTRYDLGEYDTTAANVVIADTDTGKDTVATDIISGTGTWYWQSNLYTINHTVETTLHLDLTQGLSGWGMSLQVSMLLFVGMLILGVAIVHYYYRDSDDPIGILDWVIIGLAILLCLGVAAI